MAPLLRRRLACFYCGGKSRQTYTKGLTKWRCEACEAVNYLDADGDITDPPAVEAVSSDKRYAKRIQRSTSPSYNPLDHSLFCQNCLHNQEVLAKALAKYESDLSGPRYAEFEANYEKVRESLEERYPQVCEHCEPKVLRRIRDVGYAAKTDNLRRIMERTRGNAATRRSWSWNFLLHRIGATMSFLALVGQIVWHIVCLVNLSGEDDGLRDVTEDLSPLDELRQVFRSGKVWGTSLTEAHSFAGWALLLALLSLWWNPAMHRQSHLRVTGLNEYYRLQGILNIARAVAWYHVGAHGRTGLDQSAVKAVHATMLATNLIVSLIGWLTVKIDRTPRLNFQESPKSLLSKSQWRPPREATRIPPPDTSFPMSSFGPPKRPDQPPARLPTPPPEDDPDAMDIDTPTNTVQLGPSMHRLQRQPPRQPEPSPFVGRLPPAPTGPERMLRAPVNRATFRGTPAAEQEKFFDGMMNQKTKDPKDQTPEKPGAAINRNFADPKFVVLPSPNRGLDALNALFSGLVSLDSEPPELRQRRAEASADSRSSKPAELGLSSTRKMLYHFLTTLFLLLAAYCWKLAAAYPIWSSPLRFLAVGVAAVVSGEQLISKISPSRYVWVLSDIILHVGLLLTPLYIGFRVREATLSGEFVDEALGRLPLAYFFLMTFYEAISFVLSVQAAMGRPTGNHARDNSIERMPKRRGTLPTERNFPAQPQQPPSQNAAFSIDEGDSEVSWNRRRPDPSLRTVQGLPPPSPAMSGSTLSPMNARSGRSQDSYGASNALRGLSLGLDGEGLSLGAGGGGLNTSGSNAGLRSSGRGGFQRKAEPPWRTGGL